MTGLIVHGRATSSNVQAVLWGMAELGLEPERVDVGGRHGGNDDPAFREISPMGLVPALQDGNIALFESAAILRYISQRYGDGRLWPGVPEARAQVDQWAEWGKHTFGAAFTVPIFWAHYRTAEPDRDVSAIAKSVSRFESLMQTIIPRLDQTAFIVNDDLSLADIWVGHVLYRYFTLDIPRETPPQIKDYYQRLASRPAYKTHVMVDYSELKASAS